MRAPDTLTLGSIALALAFPQDGITQPATFVENLAAGRAQAVTGEYLSRPNKASKLSTVNTVSLIVPIIGDKDGLPVVIGINRLSIRTDVSEVSSAADITKLAALIANVGDNASTISVLTGNRLV